MERLDISRLSAQAKIAGTLVALGGAILSASYKGILVISPHRRHGNRTDDISKVFLDGHWIKGSLVLFISYLSLAGMDSKEELYLQAAAIKTAILDHKPSSWRLSWNITLLAPLYSEILVFGITLYAQTLVIRGKGPTNKVLASLVMESP
ncbi:hypothetical protein CUMW_002960 [Citrus unshiu]|nr:hypothetical protein CUMW_002960 [Citrus unshiu]